MANEFNFCPSCGGQEICYADDKKWKCASCGFTLYNNVAAAVGVLLSDSKGNILLETRAKEPRKGFLAVPGGFINPDERAEDAAVRECREEIGVQLDVACLKFIASFPNVYEYKGIVYKTCDVFFSAKLPDGVATIDELISNTKSDEAEVTALTSVRVTNEQELMELPLAFDSARRVLALWMKEKNSMEGI